MRKYHHLGIPTTEKRQGEVHLKHLKIYVSGYKESPYHIEWTRYEPDAPYPELVKTLPHVAFEVDDLEQELEGKKVIIAPNSPSAGVTVAFIEDNGAPVEFLQASKALMDHTTVLAELLSQSGFHRHALVRNQVGHFQLVGLLHDCPVDILLDTGAASTVVDLSYCRAKEIPTRDTGKLGGGAGGITLAIHALDGATLSLDGHPLRSDGIYAVDLTHVNEGLVMKGASRVHGVLGADVLTYHQAVVDYATMSLFLLRRNA